MPGLTHWGETADIKCEIRDIVHCIKRACRHMQLFNNTFTVDSPITYIDPVGTIVPIRGGV